MTNDENRPKPTKKQPEIKKPEPRPTPPKRKRPTQHEKGRVPDWVSTFLVVVITMVWVASFVAGLLNPKYQVPEQVNLLFSSMVGGLLLNAASKRRGDNDGDE